MDKHTVDKEQLAAVSTLFNDQIPFNRVIGLQLELLRHDLVQTRFEMREDLIGNFIRRSLHGGVISTVLDTTGGLAAFMGMQEKMTSAGSAINLKQFEKLGTIDIRVDYLRPGLGNSFISSGYALRVGNKVAVTRIELHNEKEDLIAVGTGSYVIS